MTPSRVARFIRTVRHLRLRQVFYRLIRRGPVGRISQGVTGPPWRRFARCVSAGMTTPADDTGWGGNPFTAAPGPSARLTAGQLVVDGVPTPVDPYQWSSPSRFRLYRLHSHLFLADRDTDPAAATDFLNTYIGFLGGSGGDGNWASGIAASLGVAWEAHPLSLRLISWVRFAARAQGARYQLPERFVPAMVCQARHLARRIEYEVDGNHLIDNAVALVLAGWYLGVPRFYRRGLRLFRRELSRQLLPDGFHNERSPMYHRLMTERVLDVVAVGGAVSAGGAVATQAGRMLSALLHHGGTDADVNDSFIGMAPGTDGLIAYGRALGIVPDGAGGQDRRRDSGVYDISRGDFRVVFDADAIGPDHVPGHAHADTLQVLLWYQGRPVLVDTGTSTYDLGPRRDYERSTGAHNTTVVNGTGSSEVWGGFRVGRRARVVAAAGGGDRKVAADPSSPAVVTAAHDGYRHLGVLHRRSVSVSPEQVVIRDHIGSIKKPVEKTVLTDSSDGSYTDKTHFSVVSPVQQRSLPPSINTVLNTFVVSREYAGSVRRISARRVALAGLVFEFRGATKFDIKTSEIAAGFEKRVETVTIVVEFESELESVIECE